MDEFKEFPGAVFRDGRIIVAVTILGPDGPGNDAGIPHVGSRQWAVDGPRDWPQTGSAKGLHEALHQALLRVGQLPELEDEDPADIGPAAQTQSEWERLVEVGLRTRPRELYSEALTAMERQLLTRVLDHAGGNQTQAALILGITRGCLRAKIRTLGITIGHSVRSENDQVGHAATRDTPQGTPHG